jgi:choice-of-anchor C domain-containing protein
MPAFNKPLFGLFATMLILFALSTGSAYADLVVNGSFENGDFNACSNGAWCRLLNGATNLTGWQIGGVGVDWHNSVQMKFPHTGDKVVDLNLDGGTSGTGTISQSFATMPGEQYLLEFFLAGPEPSSASGFPDPRQVVVDIAGVHTMFSTPASLNTNIQWGDEKLLFTALATTTTLTFSSPNGAGFWGPVLDDVSVNAATPEPREVVPLLTVILGLVIRLRRRA